MIKGLGMSSFFNSNIGVSENLSPALFSIDSYLSRYYDGLKNVNDSCLQLLNTTHVDMYLRLYTSLYADDTIILAESPEQLQNALTL